MKFLIKSIIFLFVLYIIIMLTWKLLALVALFLIARRVIFGDRWTRKTRKQQKREEKYYKRYGNPHVFE